MSRDSDAVALIEEELKWSVESKATKQSTMIDVGCGAVAGMVGKIIEYPFDTLKVRLQAGSQYWSVRGLYRGLTAPLIGCMAETSILFGTHGHMMQWLSVISPEATWLKTALSGATAGFLVGNLLTPIEALKCRVQAQSSPTLLHAFYQIRRQSPTFITLTGELYRGHALTLARETVGTAAWFLVYERLSATSKTESMSPILRTLLSGACAGLAYNICMYPADTCKSYMQVNQSTFSQTVSILWKQQGFMAFWRGIGVTMVKTLPVSAATFFTFVNEI